MRGFARSGHETWAEGWPPARVCKVCTTQDRNEVRDILGNYSEKSTRSLRTLTAKTENKKAML
jgi:hypothetical protein